MNLRNGKTILDTQTTQNPEKTEKIERTQHEKDIVIALKKICNVSIYQRKCNCIDSDSELSKEEFFMNQVRLISELYYLVKYYNLHDNPRYTNFQTIYKKKAQDFIVQISETLHRSSGYNLSRRDRFHATNFIRELATCV